MVNDIKFGWRMLRSRPTVFAVSVGVCAGAIGATTAGFGLANALWSAPNRHLDTQSLYRAEARLLFGGVPYSTSRVSRTTLVAWRGSPVVELAAGLVHSGHDNVFLLTGAREPAWVQGAFATTDFFATLRARAALGRTWSVADDELSVVVSDALWRRQLGADTGAVGRPLRLNDRVYTVVGVMPRGFVAGNPQGMVQGLSVELWVPEPGTNPHEQYDEVLVRLRDGLAPVEAQGALARLDDVDDAAIRLVAIDAPRRARLAPVLRIIAIVAGVGLLVACASLASLQVAILPFRRREMAVRVALGGGRWTLFRQMLVEGLLLGVIGGVVGLLVAWWGIELLARLAGGEMGGTAIVFDVRLFAFAAVMMGTTVLVSGLPAAVQAAGLDPMPLLRDGRSTGGRVSQRVGRWVVAAQLGLAFTVVFGAVLATRSGLALHSIDLGIDTAGVAVIDLYRSVEDDAGGIERFYSTMLGPLRAAPGVADVALASSVPFRARDYVTSDWRWRIVDERYFATVGIRVTEGRAFETADRGGERVAVINRTLAGQQFPDRSPIGGQLDEYRVIGVVEDVRHRALEQDPVPVLYSYFPQTPDNRMSVLIRAQGRDPGAVVDETRRIVASLASDQPVGRVATLGGLVRGSDGVRRHTLALRLLVWLALTAVALGMTGLYGVLTQFVALQRREMSVRLALGAMALDLSVLIVRRAARMIGPALVLGFLVAPYTVRLLAVPAFGADPDSFLIPALAAVALVMVALPAVLLPARRAVRVDPALVLRSD